MPSPGTTTAGKDFYKILNVHRTASKHEIKEAYRKLALALHPDRHDGCEVKAGEFKNASEAYQTLSDHGLRTAYDNLQNGYGSSIHNNNNRNSRQPPKNYRTVYAPRPPPNFKTFDPKRHYDMHYGDGMMNEEIERARKRAEAASSRVGSGYHYRSPLGDGFEFGGGYGFGANPFSRTGRAVKNGGRTSPTMLDRDEEEWEYEEGHFNAMNGSQNMQAKRAMRMKSRVAERLNVRRQNRIRNRGDPQHSYGEGGGCVVM
mmetsp:Transcript_8689/g.12354  ORF Transcript_8689/g.12354 Transcript_8689/m.12354 type:complete len:259 (-) Transcript_8689:360-1136(-)